MKKQCFCFFIEAHQRRVIRVSETFEKKSKQRGRPTGVQRKEVWGQEQKYVYRILKNVASGKYASRPLAG